ncbi:hypothetical protein NMG60_11028028 [Bertholletia excelsa]
MQLSRSVPSWICHFFACMGGCLGCCPKPPLVIAVDKPSNGLRIPGRMVKKPSILEDFWSTSTYEMDRSASESQRSVPSMSTSNLPPDLHASGGNASNPTEFVNHGLLLWNQTRQQWTVNKKSDNRTQVREPKLSCNVTCGNLLGTNKPFPQRIPLPVSSTKPAVICGSTTVIFF